MSQVVIMFGSTVTYFRESFAELKKVSWPSRRKTARLTALVVLITVGTAAYLGALDYVLLKMITAVIRK